MAFDPYASWLGISADDRPPTYYDLLGLPSFESDPKTIDQASVRRMGKVRQHQIGPHSELSQEILAELARARVVLMDPDRRVEYDAKLRAHEGSAAIRPPVVEKFDVGAAPARPAPVDDGLDVFAQLKVQDSTRPDGLRGATKVADVETRHRLHAPAATGIETLASRATVEHQSEAPSSLRSTERISPPLWNKLLGIAMLMSPSIAAIWVFINYGRDISDRVRSMIGGNQPAARVEPQAANGQAPQSSSSPKSIGPTRSDPTTWLKFERGSHISIAKSDDFDMAKGDYTIFAQIKTQESGTIFSKAAAVTGWGAGDQAIHSKRPVGFRNPRVPPLRDDQPGRRRPLARRGPDFHPHGPPGFPVH